MTDKERMAKGMWYNPSDKSIMDDQLKCLELQYEYNLTRPSELERRRELLKKMFGSVADGAYIEPPLHANWAGRKVSLGKNFYSNFNLTLVDDETITIGDYVMVGPNCTIATAKHPLYAPMRALAYQKNLPVVIGNNVWLGAGVIILPGVTIGDNTIIGAGSVVTKDIPAGVVAVGNPCKVLKVIGEGDKEELLADLGEDYPL